MGMMRSEEMPRFNVVVTGQMRFLVDAENEETAKEIALGFFWSSHGPEDYVFKVDVVGVEPIPIREVR